jgi:hypothetical protein
MKIKTAELKKAIKSCLSGTSTKDLVVQMSHIVFTGEEILSYNDRVSIMIPFETGVSCSVPAEDLNKVLSGITDSEIELFSYENDFKIVSESTEATISTEIESRVVEDFFKEIDFSDMNWGELPTNFLDQLSLARLSASTNALDSNNLFCVFVKGKYISGGDGHRLSYLSLDKKMKEVLIPATSVSDIISFPDFDEYAIHNGWIHFSNEDGAVLSCRTITGDFPDFAPFFSNFEEITQVTVDSNLIPILQNLGGLVEGQSGFMRSVDIKIINGQTTIQGRKEGLRIQKKVENSHSGETVEFSISPDFLAHILTMTNTLSIGENSAMFSSDSFQHIVQLPVD